MKKQVLFSTLISAILGILPALNANLIEPEAAPANPVISAHITDISQIVHRFNPETNTLDLSEMNITQIAGIVFMQIACHHRLQHLKELKLNANTQLTRLPPDIGRLTNLQKLDCSFTSLAQLPSEIGHLVNLKKLYLFDTLLTQIPREICYLVDLQTLFLNNTQLAQLPPGIGNLRNLQQLWLYDTPPSRRGDWHAICALLHAQLPNTRIYPG